MTGHVKEFQPPAVSEYERGWLAGLIDGDGFLGLHIDRTGCHRRNKRGFTWKPSIVLTSTSLGIIETWCQLFNRSKPPSLVNFADGKPRKPLWKLTLSRAEIRWVCKNLVFRGKDRQRQLLLEAIDLIDKVGGKRPLSHPHELRLIEIRRELGKLNRRGLGPSPLLALHEESMNRLKDGDRRETIFEALGIPYQKPEERE